MYSILVENADIREELRNHMRGDGIETRPTFYPVHTMPHFTGKYQKHPIAEKIGWNGINLPSWPDLTDEEVGYICKSIKAFYHK